MIIVLTTPRRTRYLQQTLADVDSSAQGRRAVVVDRRGDTPVAHADLGVDVADTWSVLAYRGSGRLDDFSPHNKWPFWDCLAVAAVAGEDLVFFEDDVRLCKNAAMYLERYPVPDDVAFVTTFTFFGDATIPWGLARFRAGSFSCSQALKIPLRTLRFLVSDRGQELMRIAPLGGCDDALAWIGRRQRWLYGATFPGLVQHVGEESAVIPDRTLNAGRVSRAWPGPEFDAMVLCYRVDMG